MSDEPGNGNGTGASVPDLADQLVIEFNRSDGTMHVGGKVCNDEVALDMCNRAARYFETRCRVAAAAAAMQERAKEAQLAQVARDVVNRRH